MKAIIALMIFLNTINPIKVYMYGDEVYFHFNTRMEFEDNSAKLSTEVKAQLDAIAFSLQERPKLKIEIESHTDIATRPTVAVEVTRNRANAIKDYLVRVGVNPKNIKAVGYGYKKPLINCEDMFNCTPEENKKNRRVSIRLINLRRIGAYELVYN